MSEQILQQLLAAATSYQNKMSASLENVDAQTDALQNKTTAELTSIINSLAGWDADLDPNDAIANLNTVLAWVKTKVDAGELEIATETNNGLMSSQQATALLSFATEIELIKKDIDTIGVYNLEQKYFNPDAKLPIYNDGGDAVYENTNLFLLNPNYIPQINKFMWVTIDELGTKFQLRILKEDDLEQEYIVEIPVSSSRVKRPNNTVNGSSIIGSTFYLEGKNKILYLGRTQYTLYTGGTSLLIRFCLLYDLTTRAVTEIDVSGLTDNENHGISLVLDPSDGEYKILQAYNSFYAIPRRLLPLTGPQAGVIVNNTEEVENLLIPEIINAGLSGYGYSALSNDVYLKRDEVITRVSYDTWSFNKHESLNAPVAASLTFSSLNHIYVRNGIETTNYALSSNVSFEYVKSEVARLEAAFPVPDDVLMFSLNNLPTIAKVPNQTLAPGTVDTVYIDNAFYQDSLRTQSPPIAPNATTFSIFVNYDSNVAIQIGYDLPDTLREINIIKPKESTSNIYLLDYHGGNLISGRNSITATDDDKLVIITVKLMQPIPNAEYSLVGVDALGSAPVAVGPLKEVWTGTATDIQGEYFEDARQDYYLRVENTVLIKLDKPSLTDDIGVINIPGTKLSSTAYVDGILYGVVFTVDTGLLRVYKKDTGLNGAPVLATINGLYSKEPTGSSVATNLLVENKVGAKIQTESLKFVNERGENIDVTVNGIEAVVVIPEAKRESIVPVKINKAMIELKGETNPIVSADGSEVTISMGPSEYETIPLSSSLYGNFTVEFFIPPSNIEDVYFAITVYITDNDYFVLEVSDATFESSFKDIGGENYSLLWSDINRNPGEPLIVSLNWLSQENVEIILERQDGQSHKHTMTVLPNHDRLSEITVEIGKM